MHILFKDNKVKNNTDHMFSTYSPYDDRYIRPHHPHMEQTTLTTCLVRIVLMMIAILDPNRHIWNKQH